MRVVAPAGPVDPAALARGCDLLRSLGLAVAVAEHVLDGHRLDYLAGTDADRAADLQRAWCDPGVDAVWAARGGYGSARLIDLLDWTAMRHARRDRPAPVFVGSSDLTALHLAFAHHLGVPTCVGPMVAAEAFAAGLDAAARALFAPGGPVQLSGGVALVPGTASGVLVGGNLTLLASLAGTAELGHTAGRIVLLEDVGEAPYRIDRMLTQLLRTGWLDGATGIAGGSWERCGPPDAVAAVLADRLSGLGIPVVTGLPFGHGAIQATLPLLRPAVLDAAAGTLTVS